MLNCLHNGDSNSSPLLFLESSNILLILVYDVYQGADMAILLMDDGASSMVIATGYGIFLDTMLACVTWYNSLNNYTMIHEIAHLFGAQVIGNF